MPITKTKTINGGDGYSVNECVMPILMYTFNKDGKLFRKPWDGCPFTFDEIWTDMLGMEGENHVEGENTGGDILRCRLRELEKEMPAKTPDEHRAEFRNAMEKFHRLLRLGSLPTKLFVGASASKLNEIKQNGIIPPSWLTEDDPWDADGCHPWTEGEENVKGLVLEIDATTLDWDHITLNKDGSILYSENIPWSAVTRYVIIDWEKVDGGWEHFVTHRMAGSVENEPFTRWLMGYPVTVPEIVWPLQKYKVEDTSPDANRAWTRYEWDHHPDYPIALGDEDDDDAASEHAIEATTDCCSVEDRRWFVEDKTELLTKRDGIKVTVIRDMPWSRLVDYRKQQKKAA